MTVNAREGLAEFDHHQRRIAGDRGRPTARMAYPGSPRRDSVDPAGSTASFFWLRGTTLVCSPVARHGEVVPATPDLIAESLLTAGQVCVPLERAVLHHLERMLAGFARSLPPAGHRSRDTLDRLTDPYRGQAGRLLRFVARQPVSTVLVVLAEALSRKLWAPQGINTAQLAPWRRAFGLEATVGSLESLLAQVFTDRVDPKRFGNQQDSPLRALEASCRTAVNASVFVGAGAAASQYNAAQGIAAAWAAAEALDPLLRHRGVLDGSVCRITPVSRTGISITCTVTEPFKLREGDVVVMDADKVSDRVANATFTQLLVGDHQTLQAVFRPSSKKSADRFSMMEGALAEGRDLLVTAKPFLGAGGAVFAGRWGKTASAGTERITRDVPLDVMLAGAP